MLLISRLAEVRVHVVRFCSRLRQSKGLSPGHQFGGISPVILSWGIVNKSYMAEAGNNTTNLTQAISPFCQHSTIRCLLLVQDLGGMDLKDVGYWPKTGLVAGVVMGL